MPAAQRPSRHIYRGNKVSRAVLPVVRILIASYFLATATGLIFEPASRTFLDAVLEQSHAQLASTVYLFVTAFAIMVGVAVRPSALMLAVYIFWSGFLHYESSSADPQALTSFWRDMALLGAILLIAVTEPGGSKTFRLWSKPVAPRRVARSGLRNATQPQLPRPARQQETRTGLAINAVVAAAEPLVDLLADTPDDGAEDDMINIFADAWEPAPAPIPA